MNPSVNACSNSRRHINVQYYWKKVLKTLIRVNIEINVMKPKKNFVYRKLASASTNPNSSQMCQKCKASVWIEVGTLIVNNTAMQEHNHSPPILEMAAWYNMFLIIHNMCTVIIMKYFSLLLCNQCGNESLFCWTLLYFIHYYTLFIH